MIAATKWHRKNGFGAWRYNHLELGHSTSTHPTPKVAGEQTGWAKSSWLSQHVYLTDNTPPKVVAK